MTTGARIKARRKELGLSAEEIAKELSVSAATIYRYEKGDIEKLPGYILEPLSKILHTTPAYLMGWEDEAEQTEKPIPAVGNGLRDIVIEKMGDLTPEELLQVDAFVQGLKASHKA